MILPSLEHALATSSFSSALWARTDLWMAAECRVSLQVSVADRDKKTNPCTIDIRMRCVFLVVDGISLDAWLGYCATAFHVCPVKEMCGWVREILKVSTR